MGRMGPPGDPGPIGIPGIPTVVLWRNSREDWLSFMVRTEMFFLFVSVWFGFYPF